MAAIAYSEEAYDSAAQAVDRIKGFTVNVQVAGNDLGDHTVVGSRFDDDGELLVDLHPWSDELAGPDTSKTLTVEFYVEAITLEVL